MPNKFAAAAALTLALMGAGAVHAKEHHIVFQVNANDPQLMNLVLNNVANLETFYASKGDTSKINVVAYGPGLHMLLANSPVKERISAMALQYEGLAFDACHNTMQAMEKKTGKMPVLVDEATVVPAGVAKIVELEEDGYVYVKP